MTEHEAPVRILSQEECWQLLRTSRLGRLAASLNNQPEIFPVNFVVDGNGLVIRTAEGSKLVMVTINDSVAFEVDTCDANGAVSVVARGRARELTSHADITHAETLPLHPWVATRKTRWVRIDVTDLSGRAFRFGPEPEEPQHI